METSKKILCWTMGIFISQLIAAAVYSWFEKSTDVFVYTIPTTSGILGATIIFYLNKAKIENVFKGKIEFLKFQIKELEHCPNKEKIEAETQKINDVLDSKIDETLKNAVDEDITIQN